MNVGEPLFCRGVAQREDESDSDNFAARYFGVGVGEIGEFQFTRWKRPSDTLVELRSDRRRSAGAWLVREVVVLGPEDIQLFDNCTYCTRC